MAVATTVREDIDEILPGVVADRRHLHEHPELAFEEYETAKFVAERLQQLGVEDIKTGVGVTGVTGLIHGGKGPGKVIMLRADMDALPIEEENDVDYTSTVPGKMHACGHDAHTAMLLGAARILMDRRSEFAGTVKLLFQPAEEVPPGGAIAMIKDGALENPHVDAVLGLHVASDMPAGQIGVREGPGSAGSDRFRAVIQGKGGHAARPQSAIDPVVIASQIVLALQTLVAREVDPTEPAVVTLAAFNGGSTHNVIPDQVVIKGTIRAFDDDLFDRLERRLREVVEGVAASLRAEARVEFEMRYPPSVCDPAMAQLLGEASRGVLGDDAVVRFEPRMGAEDFAFVLQKVPGAMLSLGVKAPEWEAPKPLHTATFDLDESALPVGAACLASVALRYLDRSG